MKAMIDGAVARFGRLDCIVNNAGWHPPAMTIDQTSVEDYEALLRLNLVSTFMGCKFAVPHLAEDARQHHQHVERGRLDRPGGRTLLRIDQGGPNWPDQGLGAGSGAEGIRVNAVCPAGVMTPLMQEWANTQYDPSAALRMVDSWHPIGRMATIEEIGEVCAFLASDEASFITGQAICPDGGAAPGLSPLRR